MRLTCGLALVAALLIATLSPAAVHAQSEENRKAARAAYGLGQKLFNEDRFEDAKAAFEEAFAAVPNPVVLKSIAECEARLKQVGAAIDSFERFLKEQPESKDRADIEAKLEELRKTPAVLVLQSDPPGAAIILDGQPGGGATPIEINVSPGEHHIELSADGYDAATKTVMAGPGERAEVRLTLTALPSAPEPAGDADLSLAADDLEMPSEGGSTVALWVTGSIAVVGLAAGTVLGVMTMSKQDEFKDNPSEKGADDGERLALFADVGFGVGAIAAITFGVLLLTDGDSESDDLALRVAPVVSPTEAGAVASLRF